MLVFILLFIATPALTAVAKPEYETCSLDEFTCDDGACVSLDHYCDGEKNCADGSDEAACNNRYSLPLMPSFSRSKRQATGGECRRRQWRCRDGTCIGFDGKCDGMVDCPDGSDESFPLCRNETCHSAWFRCTYGACVDGTAPCNGIQECADNSDELLPRCRNESNVIGKQFTCANGETIDSEFMCDGPAQCSDGSDETVRACSQHKCPSYLFQCAYGACVDQGANCDGKQDCADGSDESDELCNRIGTGTTKPPVVVNPSTNGKCVLPPHPDHGSYAVSGAPNAAPGQAFATVQLNVSCVPGYGPAGDSVVFCFDGNWSEDIPKCVRFCHLTNHPSVEYRCQITGNDVSGTRPCNEYEPSGTVVTPQCRAPNYYFNGVLSFMRCIDGSFDYVAICTPECGRVTPEGEQLVIGGRLAKRGELPWHTGIYSKQYAPYMQICGGSLVSTTVVISAAHCFWSNSKQPASNYAVALGKLYRPWGDPVDVDAQKSDVSDIMIPPRFQGAGANFQEDIAIMLLTTAIVYKTYIRPVCVDFDVNFERRQLVEGKMGKVAGWGLTEENGKASQILKVVDLPYVMVDKCIAQSPPGFREYITSDKICAGYNNGTALCKGDSGGGLVFPESDRGVERYFLRGIVSTAPNNENACNAFTLTSFTQVSKHELFIKEYLYT